MKLFLIVRLSAAVWSTITDCDETFNYWEPLHFLLYGKGYQVRKLVLNIPIFGLKKRSLEADHAHV